MEQDFKQTVNIPPQAPEVEEAVLGALLLEKEALPKVLGLIDVQSFYLEKHQRIFETIKTMAPKKDVDLLTVTHELKDHDLLDDIGGPSYLIQLTKKVASAAHIAQHARIIAEVYYKRESIRKATQLIRMAYDGEDVDAISNEWRQAGERLDDIFAVADAGSHIKQVLKDTIQEMEQDCADLKTGRTPGIPTYLTSLDNSLGGWRNGDLNILAARPGVGKTTFALYFAQMAAMAGYWVNFYSWEMRKEDLTRIMLAAESDVYRSKVRDGALDQQDWKRINVATGKMEKLPIILRDATGMNIEQVHATIRDNQKHRRCDIAIIDYLQLIKPSKKAQVREQEVAEISRNLKMIALVHNIPILALSQLNRMADGEAPKLCHLRESGAIEQDADNIMFLHKPEPDIQTVRLTLAKHRRGPLGDIDIYCNEQMTSFSEIPESHIINNITH